MTATHLYRGTPSGEILDASGKVVGRIVPVEPVLNMQWAFTDQMIKTPGFPACYAAMLSAAPADWSSVAVRVPEKFMRSDNASEQQFAEGWNQAIDAITEAK